MKNRFYLYALLLIGLSNFSSISWSAVVDPSGDLITQGGYSSMKADATGINISFNLEAENADKGMGTIMQTEAFNTFKTEGKIMLNQAFAPSLTGNAIFSLDKSCFNDENLKNPTISSIDFNGQCEYGTRGLSCSNMSIKFNVYDNPLRLALVVKEIFCNASIYTP